MPKFGLYTCKRCNKEFEDNEIVADGTLGSHAFFESDGEKIG